MTRLEKLKKWLTEEGIKDLNDFEPLEDIVNKSWSQQGCWGFYCPADLLKEKHDKRSRYDETDWCSKCPYNEFWFKEV